MAKALKPSPVKLVIGIITTSEGVLLEAKKALKRQFGPLDFESPPIHFNFSQYYEKEMGPNLTRKFISFQRLILPQKLAAIKSYTNGLEKRLSRSKTKPSRKINLDPGYISAAKLVLATAKNFAHRIYLEKGIFAEVTLHFRNRTFIPWPWTYPDYKSKGPIQSFNRIRALYLQQLPR